MHQLLTLLIIDVESDLPNLLAAIRASHTDIYF